MAVSKGDFEIINKSLEQIKELKKPYIIGIDASLNNTGVVILNYKGELKKTFSIIPKDLFGVERLAYNENILNNNLYNIISEKSCIVIREGYAHGRVQGAHQMGEWGGVLKFYFHKISSSTVSNLIPMIEVAPQSLKKFANAYGKGKSSVLKEVYKRWHFDTNDDNLADAFVLAMVGVKLRKVLKGFKTKLNKKQSEVINKICCPIKKTRKKVEKHL